jgi:hypothetical protein
VPYNPKLSLYDTDNNKWYESTNEYGNNEIEKAEKGLNESYTRYKVHTVTTTYIDSTQDITSKYPNGTKITEHHGENHILVNIKDKNNRTVAEKIFNYDSNEGRKTIYHHIKQGGNIFTIVRIFSYDTNKNRRTDIVNFGYTGLTSTLTNGCELEKEYYLLNGEEVKAKKTEYFEYFVEDKNGNQLKFTEE